MFSLLRERTKVVVRCAAQRKVFTTPVRNEADDVSVTEIVPSVRGLNKKRGCAAVSIGEKCHQSKRRSWRTGSPSESGLCVKTMLCGVKSGTVRFPRSRPEFHGTRQRGLAGHPAAAESSHTRPQRGENMLSLIHI